MENAMKFLLNFILIELISIFFIFSISYSNELQYLYSYIKNNKLIEAKEELLNDSRAFGDPQKAAKIIANHLMKNKQYDHAAEMYAYCIKFSSYYDEVRKKISLKYLSASLEYPKFLDKWRETYQYEINDKMRKIAKKFLKKKFEFFKSDPINKEYPEKAYSSLAKLVGFNEKPYKEIKNAVAKIDELQTRKQSKFQVVTVFKEIKKLKKKKINIPGDLEDRYINLKKYYEEVKRGKSTNSYKTGCEAYKSALTYLNQANGQDTENAKCYNKRSCLYVEANEFVPIILPTDDDNSGTINTKIQQINDFQKKINKFRHECSHLTYPSSDHIALLDVADDYYISLKKLKNNNNENTLITFYNKYQKNKKYSDWHKLAGFHIGTHYYFTAKNLLTQEPQFNNEAAVLEKLKNAVTNFRKFRKHLSKVQINPIKQYSLLKKVLDKINNGLVKNIDTKRLNPNVMIAWDIERKINDVRTRQALARVSVENTSENSTISTLSTSTEATSSISLMKKRIRSTLSTTENTTSILTTQMTTTSISPMNKRKKSTNMDLLKKARNAFNERHYLEAWDLYKKAYHSKKIDTLIVKNSTKEIKEKRKSILKNLELDNQDQNNLDILSLVISYISNPDFSMQDYTKPSSLFNKLTITQDYESRKHFFYNEASLDEKKSDGKYLEALYLKKNNNSVKAIAKYMVALDFLFKALKQPEVQNSQPSKNQVKWKIKLLDKDISNEWQVLKSSDKEKVFNLVNKEYFQNVEHVIQMVAAFRKTVEEIEKKKEVPSKSHFNFYFPWFKPQKSDSNSISKANFNKLIKKIENKIDSSGINELKKYFNDALKRKNYILGQ
ncbi:hypothetical protein GMMP15_180021 [Candidatus Magnetomoraceae bacterium gMMP-15]